MKKNRYLLLLALQISYAYTAHAAERMEAALEQREKTALDIFKHTFPELKAITLAKTAAKEQSMMEKLIDLYEEIVKYINTNVKKPEAAHIFYPHIENTILPAANAYMKEMKHLPRLSFRNLEEDYKEWTDALKTIDLLVFTQSNKYGNLLPNSRQFFIKLHTPFHLQGEGIERNALQIRTNDVFNALQNPEENLQRVQNFYKEQAKPKVVTSPKIPARTDKTSPLVTSGDQSAAGAARARKVSILDV